MYITRDIEPYLINAVNSFPAVLISGPRQSGKSTLLRTLFSDASYVTFDDPVTQTYAKNDPLGFISRYKDKKVILDEIQYIPELFSYIKMDIDKNRNNYGKWLLSGSQQFNMMQSVSESLAGRIGIVNLLPFSYKELYRANLSCIEDLIWNGGYPELVLNPAIRDIWIGSYVRTYIERDIRNIINVQDLSLFQTFISLCAANHSQELNLASLSRDCGITQPTVNRWINLLQASFLVYCLKPFYSNFGKRLIKTPKLYFIDSAIASYLTRHADSDSLFNSLMGGAFFEGFIIMETMKIITNTGKNAELYFWRSNDGMEIDLIIETGGLLHAVEIKKTKTPTSKHAEALEKFISIIGEKSGKAYVVCNTDNETPLTRNVTALPWESYFKFIEALLCI